MFIQCYAPHTLKRFDQNAAEEVSRNYWQLCPCLGILLNPIIDLVGSMGKEVVIERQVEIGLSHLHQQFDGPELLLVVLMQCPPGSGVAERVDFR